MIDHVIELYMDEAYLTVRMLNFGWAMGMILLIESQVSLVIKQLYGRCLRLGAGAGMQGCWTMKKGFRS